MLAYDAALGETAITAQPHSCANRASQLTRPKFTRPKRG